MKKMDAYESQVISLIQQHGELTFGDIKRLGVPSTSLAIILKRFEADGIAHSARIGHNKLVWRIGPVPLYKDRDAREYDYKTENGKNGNRIIRFGDKWRTGPGLSAAPRGLGGGSPLASVLGGIGL